MLQFDLLPVLQLEVGLTASVCHLLFRLRVGVGVSSYNLNLTSSSTVSAAEKAYQLRVIVQLVGAGWTIPQASG